METLYSNAVREYIQSRPFPSGLVWNVIEYYHPYPYLQFVLYRENVNKMPVNVMLQVTNLMNEMFAKLRKDGVPIYLEVAPGVPL